MEQPTMRIGIEPGPGLVGRFGATVILIPRDQAAGGADDTIGELLGLAAEVGSDHLAPASTIASRLAAWVIGHMSGEAPAFGIVAPMRDGVVMFLRGAVWCTITEGGQTREVSGEQALTWVDQIVPGTFERLAIGAAAGRPVQADPLSDLRDGVVPGQGFVLSRTAGVAGSESAGPALLFPVPAWPKPPARLGLVTPRALAWRALARPAPATPRIPVMRRVPAGARPVPARTRVRLALARARLALARARLFLARARPVLAMPGAGLCRG